MSQFATRLKHRQHTENITDDDEFPIHLFNYPCSNNLVTSLIISTSLLQVVNSLLQP